MKKTAKAQAAMEYLMTYGWAILVIVIVLAALLYLGIFNVSPPEICTMPPGMTCSKSYLSSSNSRLNITLVNGLQKTIVITNISCSRDPTNYQQCIPMRCGGTSVTLGRGASNEFRLPCSDDEGTAMTFVSGDSYSGKINVEYYFSDEGTGAKRHLSGNIFAKAG